MMKILLIHKNNTYANYFLSAKNPLKMLRTIIKPNEVLRFQETHQHHLNSLRHVESILKAKKLSYTKVCRGVAVDYKRYSLVITLGGDGTLLSAASHIKDTLLLGVNSDPAWSIGKLCSARADTFEKILESILSGKPKVRTYQRLQLKFTDTPKSSIILNDVLIAHINPAAMSRYFLTIGKQTEEHRSSGLWIATAAGSSGAIHSAGCRQLPEESSNILYHPRELYVWKNSKYQFTGGILKLIHPLKITSFMKQGFIFPDGSHHPIPFRFGRCLEITRSNHPLQVVWQ